MRELQSVISYHGDRCQACMIELDKNLHCKKKYMTGKSKPLVTKSLSKETMQRYKLRNRFFIIILTLRIRKSENDKIMMKNNEKGFLFHLKSSSFSKYILISVLNFRSFRKTICLER